MKEAKDVLKPFAKKQLSATSFELNRAELVPACRALKENGYLHLTLITAIDWKTSWELVYHLVRHGKRDVLTLKVRLSYGDPTIPSVTGVWQSANWHERETYDLMGIVFEGHPDLRRILLPEDFDLFPLRKEVAYGNRS